MVAIRGGPLLITYGYYYGCSIVSTVLIDLSSESEVSENESDEESDQSSSLNNCCSICRATSRL